MLRGIAQFNAREFYECHETLETEWRRERRPVRLLYQGILQIAVALYHLERGRWAPALTMFERGIAKVDLFRPRCQGIDVAALAEAARRCEATLRTLGPGRVREFDPGLIPLIRAQEHTALPNEGRGQRA